LLPEAITSIRWRCRYTNFYQLRDTAVYHDEMTLRQDLLAAQFQQIKVERVTLPAAAESGREAALATVHGSLIRTVIETKHPGRLEEATNAVERAFEAKFGQGVVAGRTSALIVSAERNE
jgi:hypothetical protein